MAGSLQQLVRKRGYRERGQAAHRTHKHKTLEKKKDWQQRSRRYKQQQQLLQHLSEKARTRNPNEFCCKLLRAHQIGGGADGLKSKNAGLVMLARGDVAAATAARSPAAAAAAAAEVLRTASRSSLVSTRSAKKLQHTKKQLVKAQEKAASGAAALLQLKEQTLRQRVKKQAVTLGQGFVCTQAGRQHLILHTDSEASDSDEAEGNTSQQMQRKAAAESMSDSSESDSECRWLELAKKPRQQRIAAMTVVEEMDGEVDSKSEQSESEDDRKEGEAAYKQMHSALLHAQRLRRLQLQLQQQRDNQKPGKRRQVVVKGTDGKEIKTTKWFMERKK
ncbi:U3 small nucleolar RNA-associated protein 11 [Cyclospora cayetanensis]|uniref:U3 small nucleolar RNA-associated protein 11 n=1 Tax=Cyclospora cayetanensis TaxID=88456 RepID=A0A6P5WF70_9EIME|nr:U3 small nucleolar RNA-associated protein 11 [Cyclospora cayetanensis]